MRHMGLASVEEWARAYITSDSLAWKLAPSAPPDEWSGAVEAPPASPGRPSTWVQGKKSPKRPRSFDTPLKRAKLLHSFFHHELQAAELMCWALLRFPEAPPEFRRGLLRIALDEIRHCRLYADHIESLGHALGEFPIRDWFWDRVPACETPLQFAACMGMGFEAGNLEHSAKFAEAFRLAGDERGADIQHQVGVEEIAHVRFAVRWFRELKGELSFDAWLEELPPPLSPMVMRGVPLHRERRSAAGLDEPFLDALSAWMPM